MLASQARPSFSTVLDVLVIQCIQRCGKEGLVHETYMRCMVEYTQLLSDVYGYIVDLR